MHGPLYMTSKTTGKKIFTVEPSTQNVYMGGRLTVQGTTNLQDPVNVSCAGVRQNIACVVVKNPVIQPF